MAPIQMLPNRAQLEISGQKSAQRKEFMALIARSKLVYMHHQTIRSNFIYYAAAHLLRVLSFN